MWQPSREEFMKKFLLTILLSFYFVGASANVVNIDYVSLHLPNMYALVEYPECQYYLSSMIPPFVKEGMSKLTNNFDLAQGEEAIIADYTCNMLHVFSYKLIDNKPVYTVYETHRTSGGTGAVSNVIGSNGTPSGVHVVSRKQGDDEGWELNYATDAYKYGFKGQVIKPTQDKTLWGPKLITTRILRLRGLEGKLNNNSTFRGILIHGTPEEGVLGYHESQGCIRMNNKAVIEVFDKMKVGSLVNIVYKDLDYVIKVDAGNEMEKSAYSKHGLVCVDRKICGR